MSKSLPFSYKTHIKINQIGWIFIHGLFVDGDSAKEIKQKKSQKYLYTAKPLL